MKKIFSILGITALIGCLLILSGGKTKAASEIDQQFTSGTGSLLISTGQRMAQRFMAEKQILDKVEIELSNVGSDQQLTVAVRKHNGSVWEEGNIAEVTNQTVANGWNTFDFADVNLGDWHFFGIFVSGDYGPQWKYADVSGYGSGYAIWQDNNYYNWDFNFKTWGYNPAAPSGNTNTNSGNTNTNSQTGITSGTGQAPAATTSAYIKVPSELKAEDVPADKGGTIKLTWKASSTTTIDGYKIFRSENEKTGFKNITKATKTTLTYTDNNAETGKTFYYFVRAYKGNEESASSNTANIASVDNSAGQAETKSGLAGLSDIDTNIPLLTWYNILGGILVLAGLSYLIYKTYLNQKK